MSIKLKLLLCHSIAGFIWWTGTLTPYMLFWVGLSLTQYLKWASASLILTPLFAPGSIWFDKKFTNFFIKE